MPLTSDKLSGRGSRLKLSQHIELLLGGAHSTAISIACYLLYVHIHTVVFVVVVARIHMKHEMFLKKKITVLILLGRAFTVWEQGGIRKIHNAKSKIFRPPPP